MTKNRILRFCWMVLVCNLFAFADDNAKHVESELQSELMGKVMSLRNPYDSDHLGFAPNGQLFGIAAPLPWTTGGLLKVTKISVKGDHIEVEGKRVLIAWRSDATPPSLIPLLTTRNIKVALKADSAISGTTQTKQLLAKVFQEGNVDQRIAMYWKPDAVGGAPSSTQEPQIVGVLEGSRNVYRVQPGVVAAPQPLHTPDPLYTHAAQRDELQGTTILKVVLNDSGVPEVIEITKNLGEGLDLSALDAISQWRFNPAILDGKPVAAMINVQVTFKLY